MIADPDYSPDRMVRQERPTSVNEDTMEEEDHPPSGDNGDDEDANEEANPRSAEDDDDENVSEGSHGGKEGRITKVVSTVPFDLPDEIATQIFKTGTSLQLAEQVSEKWRAKIQSTPEFWKNACHLISVHKRHVTKLFRQRLRVGSRKSKWSDKALIWREIWLNLPTLSLTTR